MTGKNDERKPFARLVAQYASSRMYRQFVGVFTAFIRPKLLSPEHYGLWTMLKVIPQYTTKLHLGTQTAMRYEIPHRQAKGDEEAVGEMQNSVFSLSFVLTALASLGLVCYALVADIDTKLRVGLLVMAGVAMFQFWYNYAITVLRAYQRFPSIIYSNYLEHTLNVVLTILLLYFFRLYGLYASLLLVQLLVVCYLTKKQPARVRFGVNWKILRQLAAKGIPIMLLSVSETIITTSDRFIISYYLDYRELGFYGIALMTFGFLLQIPGAAREILEPQLMQAVDEQSQAMLMREYVLKPVLNTAFLMPFVIGPAFFLLPIAVQWLLPRYTAGISSAQILIFGTYFLVLTYPPRLLVAARNWQLQFACFLPLAVTANIGLSILLVKTGYGIAGVAFGTASSFFFLLFLLLAFIDFKLGVRTREWWLNVGGTALAAGAMMAAVLLIEKAAVKCPREWLTAGAKAALFGVLWLAFHWCAGKLFPLLEKLTPRTFLGSENG